MAASRKALTVKRSEPAKKSPAVIYHHFDAAFRVWGPDTDIDRLTSTTGLQPSETHRKGDRRGKGTWDDSMWSYRSQCPEAAPLEQHLNDLLNRLEPIKDRLQLPLAIPPKSRGCFWCAHYTNASAGLAGTVALSTKLMSRLAAFGFELVIDTYSDCE